MSDKQIREVGVHDFAFLLLDLGVGVVWREDQVYLSTKRVNANDPEVTCVHLLL